MWKINRIAVASTAVVLTLLGGGLSFAASPSAAAKTPSSHVSATGGDNSAVTNSVQGTVDSDGDQDAFDLIKSEEAKPQDTAPNRMTK